MRLPLLLLTVLLLAGCTGGEELAPRTHAETELARLHLEGDVEREETRPGSTLVTNLFLTNQGGAAVYEEGGCASAPWTFELRAENGTVVGPLGPAPGCTLATTRRALPAGETLGHAFSWDANQKRYLPNGTIERTPVPPGLYILRAEVTVERDDVPLRPAVEIVFRVASS